MIGMKRRHTFDVRRQRRESDERLHLSLCKNNMFLNIFRVHDQGGFHANEMLVVVKLIIGQVLSQDARHQPTTTINAIFQHFRFVVLLLDLFALLEQSGLNRREVVRVLAYSCEVRVLVDALGSLKLLRLVSR